ncbi:hypothetical protein MASR2M69_05950 [Bacteroidota bacterium]
MIVFSDLEFVFINRSLGKYTLCGIDVTVQDLPLPVLPKIAQCCQIRHRDLQKYLLD